MFDEVTKLRKLMAAALAYLFTDHATRENEWQKGSIAVDTAITNSWIAPQLDGGAYVRGNNANHDVRF